MAPNSILHIGCGWRDNAGFQERGQRSLPLASGHITDRDLFAVPFYLKLQIPELKGWSILFQLDDEVVVYFPFSTDSSPSTNFHLPSWIFQLDSLCWISGAYVHGEVNSWADTLSLHFPTAAEWSLPQAVL